MNDNEIAGTRRARSTKEHEVKRSIKRTGIVLSAALAIAVSSSSCGLFDWLGGKATVYAVESASGGVFELDGDSLAASSVPLVSTGQNATGELKFHGGFGYLAVASYNNTAPGLYRFDPADPDAGASRIGAAVSAQYIVFASDTLAYLTSADYGTSYENALYSFNPADPGAGLALVCALAFPQEIVIGADGRLYVAQNGNGTVARFNAAGSAVEAEIPASAAGTTGLLAGDYRGAHGVFVANTGDWATGEGSVDFIAGLSLETLVTGPAVDALALLDADTLVVTGGFPARTFFVSLGEGTPAATEILINGASFGGGDAALSEGKIFIPGGHGAIYVIDPDRSVTAIQAGNDASSLFTNVEAAAED
jgi:hypothetical protein